MGIKLGRKPCETVCFSIWPGSTILLCVRVTEHFADDHVGQILKHGFFFIAKLTRDLVYDAQRSKLVTVWRLQGCARIKADMGLVNDKRIVSKAWVASRIADFENIIAKNGMPAKREFARCLFGIETFGGFEPLPISIHQADNGNRHIENSRTDAGKTIKTIIAGRVQNFQTV